jgi:V/A-type H+-transporting ATPase subunit K
MPELNLVGSALSIGLSCIGSAIGCWISGAASHAAMGRTDEGHGKFIALSVAPSTQMIYGFLLSRDIAAAVQGGGLSPYSALAFGLLAGLAICLSAIYQGKVAATGIQASLKQPAVFGKTFLIVGVIETTALFAFIFSRLLIGA